MQTGVNTVTTAIDTAFKRLEALDLSVIQSTGDWALGRMFGHLAQGVDFSMSGYPEPKPKLIQATVGKLAFKLFERRGRMSHALNDPIPGEIVAELSAADGLGQLWTSLETFHDFDGVLMPHFAYGALDKRRFGKAHLMHIENHLSEVG